MTLGSNEQSLSQKEDFYVCSFVVVSLCRAMSKADDEQRRGESAVVAGEG